jgi:uncharacterized protein (DUF1778 family)
MSEPGRERVPEESPDLPDPGLSKLLAKLSPKAPGKHNFADGILANFSAYERAAVVQAAAVSEESVQDFITRAIGDEVARTLGRLDITLMPAGQFAELVAALDAPAEPIASLAEAARLPRPFKRA